MDDNSWEASFGRHSNISTGGFGSTIENTENTNVFLSVQSGSCSALMQSAVVEASSCDNGLQEEWSGLSFQNPKISTDNQPSNFMDSGKPQLNWVDNNLQSNSSLSSKPEVQFSNSNMSSSFPGFQQSGIQFSLKQKKGMRLESSHKSNQQSPKNNNKWFDRNPQQKQTIEMGKSNENKDDYIFEEYHSSHEHPLRHLKAHGPYTCNGCKQPGFTTCFKCQKDACDFYLHEDCFQAEHSPYKTHKFMGKCKFYYHASPPRVAGARYIRV